MRLPSNQTTQDCNYSKQAWGKFKEAREHIRNAFQPDPSREPDGQFYDFHQALAYACVDAKEGIDFLGKELACRMERAQMQIGDFLRAVQGSSAKSASGRDGSDKD